VVKVNLYFTRLTYILYFEETKGLISVQKHCGRGGAISVLCMLASVKLVIFISMTVNEERSQLRRCWPNTTIIMNSSISNSQTDITEYQVTLTLIIHYYARTMRPLNKCWICLPEYVCGFKLS